MGTWTGRGKGRSDGQPSISVQSSWTGSGGGRSDVQVTLELNSGPGMGSGQGEAAAAASISEGSLIGTRSEASTVAMRNGGGGLENVSDPEGNYIFALEIDGIEVAQFLECSGLKTTTDVFELQEGGMNHRVHKLPGQSRWDNIVLRYGVTSDISLLEWRDMVLQDDFGEDCRKTGSIILKNNQMEAVRRYNFDAAWPVSWEGPSLSASGGELAIEMIELAHHGVTVA
jgi:phage tail-like protein